MSKDCRLLLAERQELVARIFARTLLNCLFFCCSAALR